MIKYEIISSIGEFFGTAFFLFLGLGGAINFANSSEKLLSNFATPFCYGFSLFVSLCVWGPVSGGVFNPAITIALMVSRKLAILRGLFYIFSQLMGSIIGTWIINLIHPNINAVTILDEEVSVVQGFFMELLTTSILTMSYFMLVVEKKGGYFTPFYIGMTLFVSSLSAGPLTGASLNPARTFGPSIIWNKFNRGYWIYYFGPILGSLLAASWWYMLKFLKYEEAMGIEKNYETNSESIKENDNTV